MTTYPIGILFPRPAGADAAIALESDAAENDGLDDSPVVRRGKDVEDGVPEASAPLVGDRRPASMGITFAVDPTVSRTVVVHAEAAAYDPVDAEGRPLAPIRAEARTVAEQREQWRRRELDLAPVTVDVTEARRYRPAPLCEGLRLDVLVRPPPRPAP